MRSLEIYYKDLTEEAQERYLEFFNCEEGDTNDDLVPIFELNSCDLSWDEEDATIFDDKDRT